MRNLSYFLVVVMAVLSVSLFAPAAAYADEGEANVNFEGLKADVGADGSVTLIWNVPWWEKPTISPGIGAVECSGSLAVNPAQTTIYVLSVERYMMGSPVTVKWEATVIAEPKK